jgi:hypothetical protein
MKGATMDSKKCEMRRDGLGTKELLADPDLPVFLFVTLTHKTHRRETNILVSDPGNSPSSVDESANCKHERGHPLA